MPSTRRTVLAGLTLTLAAPAHAALRPRDAARDLRRIEDYLNGIRTLRATFTQINPDGGSVGGKLYLARPDRMRLDYDPPSKVLLVANGWQLVYWDGALEQLSYIPVSKTPLGFLLDERIKLSGDVAVTGFERTPDELRVRVVQSEDPSQGSLTLSFSPDPLQLKRWAVTDAQGLTTHVLLSDVRTDVPLDRNLFVFQNPKIIPGANNERE